MKKLSLVLAMVLFAFGISIAQRTVSGTIADDTGEPLIGASIIAKGTTVGTVTDIDGTYSLNVPDGTSKLVVSYTGFVTREIDLGASNVVDVTLSEGVELSEIVVTATGLEANKARLGYAVQNVDPNDITGAKEINLVNALSSKVAGVTVTSSSGSPGASSNIRIRGSNSINGNNAPLFVVDGVPIDNSSNSFNSDGGATAGVDFSNRVVDINSNDIESMTVLKGAAATALYGVRAANGAIVVTTKKGKEGKPTVEIGGSVSFDQVSKLPERQDVYAQGRVLGGVPTYLGPETFNGFSWGPRIADLEFDGNADYPFDKNGALVAKDSGNGQAANVYDPYNFFVTGRTTDLNASVSGGSKLGNYFISAGRLASEGVVPNATFGRTSFRVNTNINITEKWTAGMSANFVNSGGNRIQRGSNLSGVMLGLLRNSPTFDIGNGKEGQAAADDPDSYIFADGTQRSYRWGIYDNPYWVSNRNPSEDDVNRIIGNAKLGYQINPNLGVNYKIGVDQYVDERVSSLDIEVNRGLTGSIFQQTFNLKDINSDLFVNYNKQFDNFSFGAIVGHNVWQSVLTNKEALGSGFAIPGFFHISNATDVQGFEFINRRRIHGAYATLDFGFSDFLFANLTFRNDWSSTLPKENNTYQSYSASLGFAFTELDGFAKNDILSYGKLRLSYGSVGSDALIYRTLNYFNQAESGGDGFIDNLTFPAFGTNAFERSTLLGNNQLTPETTTTFEIGGEFKFWKGRVGLDVTYFNAQSTDLIIDTQLSAASGFANLTENAAEIENKGWEVMLDFSPVKNNDFEWNIGANFTKIENNVLALAPGVDQIFLSGFVSTSSEVIAGQPYGSIFGTGWQRTEGGDVIVGADGWPLTDPVEKVLGNPNPDWTLGLRNTISWKGLRLNALFDIREGGQVWCGTCGITNYFGTSKLSGDEREDVVVFDGVVNVGTAESPDYQPNTTAVALGSADETATFSSFYRVRYGFGGIGEMNVYDASWVRLRELSLGFDLPSNLFENSPFGGIGITLTGRNLWLSTDYPGIDPETNLTADSNGFGLDYFNMPNTKSYVASVKLTF